jgi:hypothetical protein
MKHSIKCELCNNKKVINGQKQIELFRESHKHTQTDLEVKLGTHLSLDNAQDRIDLKIDKPELVTHR